MKHACIRIAVVISIVGLGLPIFPGVGLAQWSVETVRAGNGRDTVRARLTEFGGRATLIIQCSQQGADPLLYLHQAISEPAVNLAYRFDDDDAVTRRVPLSQSGHVLQIWNEDEKQKFSSARRLRIQLRPFMIFDFDLRGIETIAAKLQCR